MAEDSPYLVTAAGEKNSHCGILSKGLKISLNGSLCLKYQVIESYWLHSCESVTIVMGNEKKPAYLTTQL